MIQLDKILVAVDFSDHARVALRYGAEFARTFDAEVLVCHVVEAGDLLARLPPVGRRKFPSNLTELERERTEQKCRQWLDEFEIQRGRVIIGSGRAFVQLTRIAQEENVDLMIVGTHGRGPVAHMLLGSVAEQVVRKSPCPVLTVRHGEHEFVLP